MGDDTDADISGLKDQVNVLNETVVALSEKVEGLAEAEHQDDEHVVAVTGSFDELKTQVADLPKKIDEIDRMQQDVVRYLQTLTLWWQGVMASAAPANIALPDMPPSPNP